MLQIVKLENHFIYINFLKIYMTFLNEKIF